MAEPTETDRKLMELYDTASMYVFAIDNPNLQYTPAHIKTFLANLRGKLRDVNVFLADKFDESTSPKE